jgi:hypothetical protein
MVIFFWVILGVQTIAIVKDFYKTLREIYFHCKAQHSPDKESVEHCADPIGIQKSV